LKNSITWKTSDFFTENLEHLAKCVIQILRKGNYEHVKIMLTNNISAVGTNTRELKMFSEFTEFLFSYLRVDDLKNIINGQNILHKMIGSGLDAEIFEYFVLKLDVGREFVQQELKLMPSGPENGNIFYHLGISQNLTEHKVKKCFEIFQIYLVDCEIMELMEKCTEDGETILEILVKNTDNFKPFVDGAEYIFKTPNMLQKFKKIVSKIDSFDQNILHWSADKEDIDFHISVWKLIQKTIENQDKLRNFIFQKNKSENNFLHCLLIENNKSEIIELTIQKLKENFMESNYKEILRSKACFGRNLLQLATLCSKEVKTHQILWKKLRDSCKSNEEFSEILGEVDEHGNNVFNLAALCTTAEVFEFMELELEKIASRYVIRIFFIKLGFQNRNLLQAAAEEIKSLEFHKILWKILQKYFSSPELLEFIKNCDIYGDNLLINIIEKNTKEVAELTWKKVKEVLNSNDLITEEHKENIQKCEEIIKNISETKKFQRDESKILKLKWIKNENSEALKLFDEEIQRLIEQNLNNIKFENLQFFMADENIKNHEKLWESLVKIYTNREDLKKLLLEKNQNGENFIHLLGILNTAVVIEFTIKKLKENLSESDYHEILRSRAQNGRNLLQLAAWISKEVKTHQILWKELQDSCKSVEEFLDILGQFDEDKSDVFNLAALFTTAEVFQFMEKELEKIASRDKIRKTFIKLGFANKNLLQTAARFNKSLEFHKTLWKILQKHFTSSEILEFIKHLDMYGDNLLINAIKWTTKEILELTWTEVRKVVSTFYTDPQTVQKVEDCEKIANRIAETKDNEKDEEIRNEKTELLKLDWIENPNSGSSDLFNEFIQDALRNNLNVRTFKDLMPILKNKNVLNHKILWEQLLNTFENRQELAKLLFEKDKNVDSFIHRLVVYNTAEVIEFTIQKHKENLSESDYHEILRSNRYFGRNLLQVAAVYSKEVKTHQILWKAFRDSCKSDEEFLEIIQEFCNVLGLAAEFSTGEIFKFIQKELEKIELHEEVKKLLINIGFKSRNLLQLAACQNKSLELHETVWEIIEKYFSSSEILQFIKYCDVYGHNVLLNAIEYNTKEVKELTWNKVSKIIITIGYENNENLKLCDEIMKEDKNFNELTKEEKEILRLYWISSTNLGKLFEDNIQLFIQKEISIKSLEDLIPFMADKNVKKHEILWKKIEESFKTYEELKKLLFEKDENGNNYVYLLVIYNTPDVIKFTLNKFKENLNESDYQEILRSKGYFERNLLQRAACASKEVKTHQILWRTFRDSFKSDQEFLEILGEIDVHGNNVLHLAAAFMISEVFEFMFAEIKKIKNEKEIRKLLTSFRPGNANLLQSFVTQNKSIKAHKTIWKTICEYFKTEEILEFIENCDNDDNNLLCCAVIHNIKEIVEFTWNQIIIFINTKEAQIEYLNRKGFENKSLYQLSLFNQANDLQVADWMQQTIKEYETELPK